MVIFVMRESLQPPPMIADVMADDGISWSRLVTAVVLLGLSVAIGYRTSRDPPRPDAVPQPVHESVVAAVELPPLDATVVAAVEFPPLDPAVVAAPATLSDVSAPAGPSRLKAYAEPRRAGERRHIGRAANRSAVSQGQGARPRRHHVARAGREPGTSRPSVRTRAQVRGEYLRSREVVAALTGEDSGSAYLTRAAARQRAARFEGARSRRR